MTQILWMLVKIVPHRNTLHQILGEFSEISSGEAALLQGLGNSTE